MKHLQWLFTTLVIFLSVPHAFSQDLDEGNAAVDVVIPAVLPAISEVSPVGEDASLVLRFTTLITNAWYDASAPYHPTAIGVYSDLGRRPASESENNYNINVALLYASYHVLNSLFPARAEEWDRLLLEVGLDPTNNSTDLTTPVGIGNSAGAAVAAARANDGMNQLGNEGDQIYHQEAYADYTGYVPVNTAYELTDPSRWQPDIVSDRTGIFRVQHFVTPQLSLTMPYSYSDPGRFRAPEPTNSNVNNIEGYTEQANQVLDASANLTDKQKLMAELFNNKIALGFVTLSAAQSQGLSLLEFIQLDFLSNMAAFDTLIAIWNEKVRYDAVRPFSAIAYLYEDTPVTAWGGPGLGTVNDLPGNQWEGYLQVADHPEYPSATAGVCSAQAKVSRLFLDTDELNYTVPAPQGSSRIEPGVTPEMDIELYFSTWSDFAEKCGQSRFWAGLHFPAAIPAGDRIGEQVAKRAYKFLSDKIAGK